MSKSKTNSHILGILASIVGTIGVFVYFTGWIYRWAYFGYFQIEITNLELPLESFFIVAVQVFAGNPSAILRTLLGLFLAVIFIRITLLSITKISKYLLQISGNFYRKADSNSYKKNSCKRYSRIAQELRLIAELISHPLQEEIVIVIWVLIILFSLARSQGTIDARRDAINDTSTRPVITLLAKGEDLALGRKLDDVFTNPSLEGYRIIGDKGLFDNIRGQEINDNTNPKQPIVWRLLIKNNNWIYLLKTLPADALENQRPYVLAIQESQSGNQLLILSPEGSK